MSRMPHQPHSAEFFGEQRDYWWNQDFLDLMARRWRLEEVSSLADIGCGVGHWSLLLYPRLRAPARLAAVDREECWVTQVEEKFRRAFPEASPGLFSFHQGDACRLPLADGSFDAVTCQTLLMHLADPRAALQEMLRILRPGGIIICVEPDNFRNLMGYSSLSDDEPVESLVRRYEFWLRQHRGRMARLEGNHSIGELLPGYFAELGLSGIAVHQSDRPSPLFPPYQSPDQQALIAQDRELFESAASPWDKEKLRRLVLPGGGTESFFETAYADLAETFRREQEAIDSGVFHAAGGGLSYLVSARKP